MKIDTHNSFDLRFSSISDINRLIAIDYYRLQSILSIIEFHRLGMPGAKGRHGGLLLVSVLDSGSGVSVSTPG